MIEILILIFLFFILTPGILLSYPKKTNKYLIGLLHAVLFTLIWNYLLNSKREGMDPAPAKNEDEDDVEDPPINILKFVLTDNLYNNSTVTDKIKAMDGPPQIVGASQFEKNIKSHLLFTNAKNKTSKLDNIDKFDILDVNMKKINDFIEFHKKYPDM